MIEIEWNERARVYVLTQLGESLILAEDEVDDFMNRFALLMVKRIDALRRPV